MSTKFKEDAYVLCPYYRKEAAIEIKCSGICGTHTMQIFESGKAKREFKEDFCMSLYQNCPCYISLEMDGK